MQQLRIFPIYAVETGWHDIPAFDLSMLPLALTYGITLEDVTPLFKSDPFSWASGDLSRGEREALSSVRYALVERVEKDDDHTVINVGPNCRNDALEGMMACLRLIRPMREKLGVIRGFQHDDGHFEIKQFTNPYNIVHVPEMEKLYSLRTVDALLLREISAAFLQAMDGDFWKLRMAVEFFQAGFFQDRNWKARFFFRCSALSGLFSSKKHRGSAVEKARIARFLGSESPIYEKHDIPSYFEQAPQITVGTVIDDLYQVRNCIAHGDRIPQRYFSEKWRRGLNEPLSILAVLDEAASAITRRSIVKIVRDNLVEHFRSSESVDVLFSDI